jgi:hypothetical protein
MLSISLLALILLPILLVGMGIIGSLVRATVRWLSRTESLPPQDWPEAFGRLVEDVALGVAVIPILYLIGTLLGVPLGVAFAYGLLGTAGAVFLARLLLRRTAFGIPFRIPGNSRRPIGRLAAVSLGITFILIVADRLVPYAGYQVYSGNDIRLFTLITQLVESHGHFVTSFGSFAGSNWNVVQDSHLTFSGSEAVFAVLNGWVPWTAPQLVSASVLVVGILLPASSFVFIRALFPNRSYSVPFFGAVSFGVIAAYPLFFQDWGGIDEQLTWFLFPIALAIFLAYLRLGGIDRLILAGLTLGGTIVVNPFPVVYIGLFFVALALATVLTRESLRRLTIPVVGFLGLGLVISSPLIVQEISIWQTYSHSVPAGYAGWNAFQTAVILRPGDLSGSVNRFLTLTLGFAPVMLLVVLGWFGLVAHVSKEKHAITMIAWALGLIILNTNGPFGLYFVQYPGWSLLYPDRLAELVFLPLSVGMGLVLAVVFDRIRVERPQIVAVSRPSFRSVRKSPVPVVVAVTFVSLVAIAGFASYQIAASHHSTVAWGDNFTNEDAAAFQWMTDHLPKGATVMIDAADSGTWIPEFTGIRVFPYAALINNVSVYDQAMTIPSLFNTTAYGPALNLIHEFNISYVYFGERTGYGLTQDLTTNEFLDPSSVSDFVVAGSTCSPPYQNRSLVLTCNNDAVTFRGPIVLALEESRNSTLLGTVWVAIPPGALWTFVLHSGTPQWPGTWVADFSAVPLAALAFSDHNAAVLQFYPLFLQLATAQAVGFQNISGTVPQLS